MGSFDELPERDRLRISLKGAKIITTVFYALMLYEAYSLVRDVLTDDIKLMVIDVILLSVMIVEAAHGQGDVDRIKERIAKYDDKG